MWASQGASVSRLFHAARRNRLELLLEVITSKVATATAPGVRSGGRSGDRRA